tara:strand:+ start:208 stop:381 length:174 start_codon:yes stop_codon:yes gene_type:complete
MGQDDKNMTKGKEFKVIIKPNGHIIYNGDLIALLGQWNKYEDLDPDTLINQLKRKKK